ncbi:MAG: hypothetical protein Q7K26_01595 [bacterium]|nr:hypothetical protein [bacterium]
MTVSINQVIIRRLRSSMTTVQQEYFNRVFVNNENSSVVRREMELGDDIEENMLRSLRTPVGVTNATN